MKVPFESQRKVTNSAGRGLGQKVMDLYFCPSPKRIEKWKNGRLYELLGIKIFKKGFLSRTYAKGISSRSV